MKHWVRVLAGVSLLSACTSKDPCLTTDCGFGTCEEGACICLTGYDGPNCATASRERFVGDWTVAETCEGNAVVYDCAITLGGNLSTILFQGLGGGGVAVTGTVSGLDVEIPEQYMMQGYILGRGSLDTAARVISVDYTIDPGTGTKTTCLATFYPQ